ncbi:O-methyltransferase [Aurantibacillus circumpalustris]|uniref:O-methyltransferase n=1 Tax=Aurantibacillus circumpalustris TaxID=3036359 RepID=UPI00295BB854|nr:class I SAM-dependent methyltransferase [Aurantibacillus circumpalustris]
MTINIHQIKHFIGHFILAKRNGHGIHSPFAYQLCEEVFYNHNQFYDFKSLNSIRNGLLANQTKLSIEDFGAGSKTFKTNTRTIKDIASKGISSRKQSELLYKLLNFLKCKNVIELGTALGLNTLYLALANKKAQVISIEGSSELYNFAQQLSKKNNTGNIHFTNNVFDKALPETLTSLNELDFLYVDGNHTYEATLNYFHQALKKKHNNSVFIFDDIYWSKGMTKAWQEIKKHPSVRLSIDSFYFGMVFFKEELKEKVDLKLFLHY